MIKLKSRPALTVTVRLPKGVTPNKARTALRKHLGFTPERILREAIQDQTQPNPCG